MSFKILFFTLAFLLSITSSAKTQANEFVEFTGTLEAGKIYRAAVLFDQKSKTWRTKFNLKLPEDQAGEIVWSNIEDFAKYDDLMKNERHVFVFEVVSQKLIKFNESRWNAIYQCRVLRVESTGKDKASPITEEIIVSARCRYITASGKRRMSYIFNFDVVNVLSGKYDKKTIEFELYTDSDEFKLVTVAKEKVKEKWICDADPKDQSRTICRRYDDAGFRCQSEKAVELTFLQRSIKGNSNRYYLLTNYKLQN